MKTVVVAGAPSYKTDELRPALQGGLERLLPGGLASLIRPGDTVAIKVNMLMGKSPAKAITTHPALVREVCLMVRECGGRALIIDSPGGPYTPNALRRAYEKCGFAAVAEETGAALNFDTATVQVRHPERPELGSALLLRPAVEANIVINLPKLKTHGLTVLTCAVKNMFGLVPGLTKIEYHLLYPAIEAFCHSLVQIAELSKTNLTIVDAVEAMEGEGPSGGSPRNCGVLLLGTDMHAVDMVAARLMGIAPATVPTIAAAHKLGVAPSPEEILLSGSLPKINPFLLPSTGRRSLVLDRLGSNRLARALAQHLRPRLYFEHTKCTRCGVCVESCPPQALTLATGSVPTLDMTKCISCFCCQELCPEHAVVVQRSWLAKVFR